MRGRGWSSLMVAAMLATDAGAGRRARPRGRRKERAPMTCRRKGEAERRRRQIERGQLRAENGLRVEANR